MKDEDVKLLIEAVTELERGCDCEYDYICERCTDILLVKELASRLKEKFGCA
jgi:hypothetical protein